MTRRSPTDQLAMRESAPEPGRDSPKRASHPVLSWNKSDRNRPAEVLHRQRLIRNPFHPGPQPKPHPKPQP
jgi:hypothetical protein